MFEPRRRTAPLLIVMCLGHVLLISAQVQSGEGTSLIEAGAFGVFARVQQGMATVSDTGRHVWTRYFALSGAARENEDLRRRVAELEGELQLERARSGRTGVLESALSLKRTLLPPTIAARVLSGNPADFLDIVIDAGADDGVERDMAVIAAGGVVGRVVQTYAGTSRVQLLVSGNAAAHAYLTNSGTGGMILGRDGRLLDMQFVSNLVQVEPGELVLTSGQEGIYPPGLVIGQVETSESGDDYRTISVRPAVDFSHIDVVLVILSRSGPPGAS